MKTETKDMEGEFDDALNRYLNEDINYTANTLGYADIEDLKQLASDSFHAGYQSLRSELQAVNHDKENMHIVHCRMLESRDKEIASLKELNGELVIGQEQQALNLVRLGDLLDRCFHFMNHNPPNIKKMSYNEWESILEELNYYRSESLIKKSNP